MDEFWNAFRIAGALLLGGDHELYEVIARSLMVSLSAAVIAPLVAMPLGALLAITRFPGRKVLVAVVNALMGLPSVVVGLVVYILLSRSGPMGGWGLLFTPGAMIIAQALLIAPLICALTRQTLEELWAEYAEQLRSFGVTLPRMLATLLWEGRFNLLTTILAGFGRAIGEVGAVLIVGGNIAHVTRVMTTSIALETARGNLALALAIGLVLLLVALAVNGVAALTRDYALRHGIR